MKDDLRYTPTDCFETFPFPLRWQSNTAVEQAGTRYYGYRAELMKRTNSGLTGTYNRFHNKCENDHEIEALRQLHAEMDRAVLDAYGWTDLQPKLDFILDYEDSDGEDGHDECKKPWHCRWVDEDRDEILARLLELNRSRAEEETQSSTAPAAPKAARKRGRKATKPTSAVVANLFEVQEPTE